MTTVTSHHLGGSAAPDGHARWHGCPSRPAPVFVWLNLATGDMGVDYTETPDSIPEAVWLGEVRRYSIGAVPTTGTADQLLDELAPMAQRVVDGVIQTTDDGGVGLSAAGEAAEDALKEHLDRRRYADADLVAVIYADEIATLLEGEEYPDITPATTDADLERIAAEYLDCLAPDHGAVSCPGLYDHLAAIRDERREPGA